MCHRISSCQETKDCKCTGVIVQTSYISSFYCRYVLTWFGSEVWLPVRTDHCVCCMCSVCLCVSVIVDLIDNFSNLLFIVLDVF